MHPPERQPGRNQDPTGKQPRDPTGIYPGSTRAKVGPLPVVLASLSGSKIPQKYIQKSFEKRSPENMEIHAKTMPNGLNIECKQLMKKLCKNRSRQRQGQSRNIVFSRYVNHANPPYCHQKTRFRKVRVRTEKASKHHQQ